MSTPMKLKRLEDYTDDELVKAARDLLQEHEILQDQLEAMRGRLRKNENLHGYCMTEIFRRMRTQSK